MQSKWIAPKSNRNGIVLSHLLNINIGFKFTADDKDGDKSTTKSYHRIIEAFKFAYAYRALLGDPDHENGTYEVGEKQQPHSIRHLWELYVANGLSYVLTILTGLKPCNPLFHDQS